MTALYTYIDCMEERNNSEDVASGRWYFHSKGVECISIGQVQPLKQGNWSPI